jgi:hypothetical protein
MKLLGRFARSSASYSFVRKSQTVWPRKRFSCEEHKKQIPGDCWKRQRRRGEARTISTAEVLVADEKAKEEVSIEMKINIKRKTKERISKNARLGSFFFFFACFGLLRTACCDSRLRHSLQPVCDANLACSSRKIHSEDGKTLRPFTRRGPSQRRREKRSRRHAGEEICSMRWKRMVE